MASKLRQAPLVNPAKNEPFSVAFGGGVNLSFGYRWSHGGTTSAVQQLPNHMNENSLDHWKTEVGTVLVSPTRGRLLNISIAGQDAFWTPENPNAAWNIGGVRLWYGPEPDWHWVKPETTNFEHYKVSSGLDPDFWEVQEKRHGYLRCSLQVELRCPYRDVYVKLCIQREIEMIPQSLLRIAVQSVAVLATTRLEILEGTAGQSVDAWELFQVPFGGSMLIPTVGACSPRNYFNEAPASEISLKPMGLEIQNRGVASFKIGISPECTTGLLAYVRPVPGGHLVVMNSFPVHPTLFYCDAPVSAAGTQGDALQIYCDDGKFGAFGELEHHSHAIRCGTGPQSLVDTSIAQVMLLNEVELSELKSRYLPSFV